MFTQTVSPSLSPVDQPVELSLVPKEEDSYSAEPVNHLKTPVFNWSDMYSAH